MAHTVGFAGKDIAQQDMMVVGKPVEEVGTWLGSWGWICCDKGFNWSCCSHVQTIGCKDSFMVDSVKDSCVVANLRHSVHSPHVGSMDFYFPWTFKIGYYTNNFQNIIM